MSSLNTTNKLELEQARSMSSHLNDLSHDFMGVCGLSHVWVTQYYFDGRYLDITNDLSWKEIMVANDHYNDFVMMCLEPMKVNPRELQFLTWESQPSIRNEFSNFTDKVHQHGIRSEITLSTIFEDHFEIYGFGSPKGIVELCDGLPSLMELKMFCLHLREGIFTSDFQQNLLLGNIGRSFNPPQPLSGYNHVPVPDSFSLSCDSLEAKLSRRELICLGLLARGYGQKEAAQIMKLSPRTVEFHLNQVKAKLNNPTRSQLITSFYSSPLAGIDPLLLLETR